MIFLLKTVVQLTPLVITYVWVALRCLSSLVTCDIPDNRCFILLKSFLTLPKHVFFFLLICLMLTTGIFEALMSPEDAVFSDQLNHASIIDGLRLCKARKLRYKHKGVYFNLII